MYKSLIVESTTYPKIKVLTLLLLEKLDISGNFNYVMSLQDHSIQMYLNISKELSL